MRILWTASNWAGTTTMFRRAVHCSVVHRAWNLRASVPCPWNSSCTNDVILSVYQLRYTSVEYGSKDQWPTDSCLILEHTWIHNYQLDKQSIWEYSRRCSTRSLLNMINEMSLSLFHKLTCQKTSLITSSLSAVHDPQQLRLLGIRGPMVHRGTRV